MKKEKQILANVYGFEFPESFFKFYEFTKKVPKATFKGFEGVLQISLGEVFNVFKKVNHKNFNPLKNSRSYNDPPEFFTLLYGYSDGLHWGYYLDDLNDIDHIQVAAYYNNDAFELYVAGNTIFEAFRNELELRYAGILENMKDEPEYIKDYTNKLKLLDKIRDILITYETADRLERGWEYNEKYQVKRKTIADTRDKMGIVVPKKLYRPLKGKDKFQVWNYVPSKKEVDTLYKNAMKALDQGFPGTALKTGKDLWIYREHFSIACNLLHSAYEALGRTQLSIMLEVAKAFREECDIKNTLAQGKKIV